MAVPMACVPVAQADTTPKLGPLHLCSMATTPDAVLEMRAGIRKGDTCHTICHATRNACDVDGSPQNHYRSEHEREHHKARTAQKDKSLGVARQPVC